MQSVDDIHIHAQQSTFRLYNQLHSTPCTGYSPVAESAVISAPPVSSRNSIDSSSREMARKFLDCGKQLTC
jgi:hypothetical protein